MLLELYYFDIFYNLIQNFIPFPTLDSFLQYGILVSQVSILFMPFEIKMLVQASKR